jgi:hypothetical protein
MVRHGREGGPDEHVDVDQLHWLRPNLATYASASSSASSAFT